MSSLRVRAQNKLLNTIGASKPSKNVQFDFAYAGFERTQAGIAELEAALRNYIICLKGYHMSAQSLVGVIDKVGGDVENSAETKQFATDIKSGFVQLDGYLLNDSVKRFEQRVLNPATGWLNRARALKQQIAAYNEEKLIYDHYTRKVMALREARDKRAGSGKVEKPKDVEKLVRNEQKYAAITNSYSKISDQTIANLRDFVNCREDTLTPIMHRMLEFRVKYAQDVFEKSQKLQPLIKNGSKYEAVLGQLESFVGRVTGSAGTIPSSEDTVKEASEPEAPVRSFSFASFVGEEPPAVPPDASESKTNSFGAGVTSRQPPPPPLASPTSPDDFFFDDNAASPTISPMAAAPMLFDFQPPPPPPLPPSVPTDSTDKWSSFPSKPTEPRLSIPSNFATTRTGAGSFPASQAAVSAPTWGAFDDLAPPAQSAPVAPNGNPFQFQTDFAQLHQNALSSDDAGAARQV